MSKCGQNKMFNILESTLTTNPHLLGNVANKEQYKMFKHKGLDGVILRLTHVFDCLDITLC